MDYLKPAAEWGLGLLWKLAIALIAYVILDRELVNSQNPRCELTGDSWLACRFIASPSTLWRSIPGHCLPESAISTQSIMPSLATCTLTC